MSLSTSHRSAALRSVAYVARFFLGSETRSGDTWIVQYLVHGPRVVAAVLLLSASVWGEPQSLTDMVRATNQVEVRAEPASLALPKPPPSTEQVLEVAVRAGR